MRFEIQRSKFLRECCLVLSHSPQIRWDASGTVRQESQISLAPENVGRSNRLILPVLRSLVSNLTECSTGPLLCPMGAAGQVNGCREYERNPGNVSPLDDPVPDALEQADTRRPRQTSHAREQLRQRQIEALHYQFQRSHSAGGSRLPGPGW